MNDTSFGINNEGSLVFDYYHEDSDQVDGANVYNGQLSTLWVNFKQAFPDLIQETYQDLRSNSILNYDELINQFITKGSDKWSESVYNEDGDFKYVSMLRSSNDATNLPQVRGTGEEHFRYFVENRLNYCDSKWYAGEYISRPNPDSSGESIDNFAVLRIYTPVDEEGNPRTDLVIPASADITLTLYSHMYAGVRYKANGSLMQQRLSANETYTFEAPNEIFNDTETAIYGAPHLSSLGDLAPLYLGYIDVGAATKLVELKIGDATPGYKNDNLYHLALGTNRLLKKIDIQNCTGFNQALVLTGCPNIEEVYAKGSSITGVELPDSGYLKILQLPSTITNLTLKNQFYIEDLTIEGLDRLKTLTIENTPVDTLGILSNAVNVERVRLTDVDWHYDDASILYELINRDIGGIDENGTNTDTMWIDGKCHIEYLTGDEYAEIKRLYPYLDITYTTLESQLVYMSEDGQTELHRETILNGGNGTDPVANGTIPTPTKESTAQYVFTHSGWSLTPGGDANNNALISVEADRVIYASFAKEIRYYTVKFYNGTNLSSSVLTAYGKDGVPCKKNLFNINSFNMNKVINNGNGSLTITGYIPIGNILDKVCCNLKIGETYIWSGSNLTQIHFGGKLIVSNEPFVFTQDMFEANTIGFYAKGTTSESSPYTISNIQLERGSMVTTYEPYTTITPTRTDVDNPEDFEFIGWKPEPTNIQGDTDCYAQYYDTREIMDDWTAIASACLDGTATEKYAVGSYKPVTIVNTKLPYDFYDGSAVVFNNEIHILGGADNVRKHYKFNGVEWVEASTLPFDFYWGSAVVYNNEIHIIGSYASGNSKKHYKYSVDNGWAEVSTLPYYVNRNSAVVYNDEIHIMGSLGISSHYKYNDTDGWVEVSTLDTTWYDGSAVVFDNKIHIFGGTTYTKHGVYDGNEWAYLNDMPYEQIRGQAIVYNHEIHLFGSDYSSLSGVAHYKLNASGEYTKDIDLPYICSRFATVVYNDKLHILGDYNQYHRNSHYLLSDSEWVPNGEYEIIDMEVIAHNHDELTDGVYKWEKVGTLPDSSYMNAVVTLNNEAYIFNSNYKLYKYDGTTYTHLADLDAYPVRETLVVYNDEIHFLNGTNHYKWNGTELSVVCTLPIDSNGSTMAVYNGEMYWFGNMNASYRANCYKWSGTEWVALSVIPFAIYSGVAITYQDKLHVLNQGGHFTFDGSNWVQLLNLSKTTNNASMVVWKDEMYLIGGSSTNRMLYKYNGESWIEFGTLPYPFSVGGAVVFNDEIHIFGGDGVAYRSNHWRYAGARWESEENLSGVYPYSCNAFEYNNTLYISDNNTWVVFDGNEYVKIPQSPIPTKTGTIYNGELYTYAYQRDTSHEYYRKVYKYNGTEWVEACTFPGPNGSPSFVAYDDKLYAIGGHYTDGQMYSWDGNEWTDLTIEGSPIKTGAAFVYNNKIQCVNGNERYEYDGTSWTLVDTLPYKIDEYNLSTGRVTVRDNEIYVIPDNLPCIMKYDGEQWLTIPAPDNLSTKGSSVACFRGKIHIIGGLNHNNKHWTLRNPRATLTFFAREAMNESRYFDQNYAVGWSDCALRTWLNEELLENFTNDLNMSIRGVNKMSSDAGGKTLVSSIDKCWVPSVDEMGVDLTNSFEYVNGLSEPYDVFTDSGSRRRAYHSGEYTSYLLRDHSTTGLGYVSHMGMPNFAAHIPRSVVFGFCI